MDPSKSLHVLYNQRRLGLLTLPKQEIMLILLDYADLSGFIEGILSLADPRGAQGRPPAAQILSILCSFRENLAKSYVGCPLAS